MSKKSYIILVIAIISFGVLLTGGTYAWLTFNNVIVNGSANGTTTCFLVDYNYTNIDGSTTNISGTLEQSAFPTGGLSGKISMGINANCKVSSVGYIYLKINSGTSSNLYSKSSAHCEKKSTLETLPAYTSSSACTGAGHSWVTNGSALKYALYDSTSVTDVPLAVGYIDAIEDITVYGDFELSSTAKSYYLYVWLDGQLAGPSYAASLPFSGYVHLGATQVE